MATSAAIRSWLDEFRAGARRRKLRIVGGGAFVVDDVYIAILDAQVVHPGRDKAHLRVTWSVDIKPLAVDEFLWAAFLPDVDMSARMRVTRRVNGAFTVRGLRIASGESDVDADAMPDWDAVFDEFDRVRTEFVEAYPDAAGYVRALEAETAVTGSGAGLVRTITALLAADRSADAAQLAEDAIARGERGPMSSRVDVLKYLAAYARGPEAYAALQASLEPTHEYHVHCETERSSSGTLLREHSKGGGLARYLATMDGANPWAVILSALPPAGAPRDHSTSLYVQAAGTRDAMSIEFCRPGGAELGAVSVRAVVGRSAEAQRASESHVDIALARLTLTVEPHEVFTADEAAPVFEAFFRSDALPDGLVMRDVEGFTAEGGSFVISQAGPLKP